MGKRKRKIVVLGAGASIGSKRYPIRSSHDQIRDTMPSADNFFYDFFKTNKTADRPAGALNLLGLTMEHLNGLITRAWNINHGGFDHAEWKGVNIEEVMTFFEIGSLMSPDGSEARKYFKTANEMLLDFLYPYMPMICEGQHCEYLQRVFWRLGRRDSIISYNWDTIAEYTLATAKAEQLRNYAKLLRAESVVPSEWRDEGLLLKLHGSFNWSICEDKRCENSKKIIPPFQKKRYQLLPLRSIWSCPICGGNVRPVIVPPVSNKLIHKDTFLRNLWLIAREKLLDVGELVFIGYSFPPTDHYTEWLFRQLNFIEEPEPVKVVIVNPEYGKKGSLVTKRYNSIFRGHEIESHISLKEYVGG